MGFFFWFCCTLLSVYYPSPTVEISLTKKVIPFKALDIWQVLPSHAKTVGIWLEFNSPPCVRTNSLLNYPGDLYLSGLSTPVPQTPLHSAHYGCSKRCPQPPTLSGSQNSTTEVEPSKPLRGDTINNHRCTGFKFIFCVATVYYKSKMLQGFWKIEINNFMP